MDKLSIERVYGCPEQDVVDALDGEHLIVPTDQEITDSRGLALPIYVENARAEDFAVFGAISPIHATLPTTAREQGYLISELGGSDVLVPDWLIEDQPARFGSDALLKKLQRAGTELQDFTLDSGLLSSLALRSACLALEVQPTASFGTGMGDVYFAEQGDISTRTATLTGVGFEDSSLDGNQLAADDYITQGVIVSGFRESDLACILTLMDISGCTMQMFYICEYDPEGSLIVSEPLLTAMYEIYATSELAARLRTLGSDNFSDQMLEVLDYCNSRFPDKS